MHGAGTAGFFKIYAINVDDGFDVSPVPPAQLSDAGAPGRPTFDGATVDNRTGLNIVNGRIFATFADVRIYDKGNYHGWIVSIDEANLANQLYFSTTTTVRGGGVWGSGGVAVAADGTAYASTGNATTADDPYWMAHNSAGHHPGDVGDCFEGVVRVGISFPGGAPHLGLLDWYQPTWAKALNDADLDFGGSSPMVLPTISGHDMVVTTAKDGNVYLLNRVNLGHWGGELWTSKTDPAYPTGRLFADESKSAPAHLRTLAGDDWVYVTGTGTPGIVAFKVVTSPSVKLQEEWRSTIGFGDAVGSPSVMAQPGTDNALVWVMDTDGASGRRLVAFNALTGHVQFDSSVHSTDDPGTVPHFPPLTVAGGSVLCGTNAGFVGYTLHPLVKLKDHIKDHIKDSLKDSLKDIKDAVKEIKDKEHFKDIKDAHKEIVDKIVDKIPEPKPIKEIVEGGPPSGPGDPAALAKLHERVSALEQKVGTGQPFIGADERPPVGADLMKEPPKGPKSSG
jgi:hypothetical protein